MKKLNKFLMGVVVACSALSFTSCNDFLDITPASSVTPEVYFTNVSHLSAYTINLYTWFPHHDQYGYGLFGDDQYTDDQVHVDRFDTRYVPGQYKVPSSGGSWNFDNIYNLNYMLDQTIPKWKAGEISGSEDLINHYIGEAYFLRAYAYFMKLRDVGDFPIVRNQLTNNKEQLVAASVRQPRNEVARFILSDLDSAIMLMGQTSPDGNGQRLSKPVAQLFKSRVALFEGSWLTNFANTPFVPGGSDWPGAKIHPDFSYKAGSLENEAKWFFKEAYEAAEKVVDYAPLTENNGITPQPDTESNPFFDMYVSTNLSSYSEVLLWREYLTSSSSISDLHYVCPNAIRNNSDVGLTHGFVMSFLDENGLPWYAPGAKFTAEQEDDITNMREGRDSRIKIFLKEPGQTNVWINPDKCIYYLEEPAFPDLLTSYEKYTTGYCSRKGASPDGIQTSGGGISFTACPIFRSAEAYLNYIEAYYLCNGRGGRVDELWDKLRVRAGIASGTINATIAALDMEQEKRFDWGAYTAGEVITDKTLYAIRKERRSEMMQEGLRYETLLRWRSFDQLIDEPYLIQGMKFWDENSPNYKLAESTKIKDGSMTNMEYILQYCDPNSGKATFSSPNNPDIPADQRVYRNVQMLNTTGTIYKQKGLKWAMAHYLAPIATKHFQLTSESTDGVADVSTSVIYQNPYWSTEANSDPIK